MSGKPTTVLLHIPPAPVVGTSPIAVTVGLPIPPIDRIKIFSSTQWEEFVLEWVDSLRAKYGQVERWGGAGDMGVDVVATDAEDRSLWDNFQCKHYRDPLRPSDIWVEIGKLVYYTHRGEYTCPRRYFFVAPQGAGTKLSNLFKRPQDLRDDLIANWDGHCRTGITSTQAIDLDDGLLCHIAKMDFSIFEAIPPLRILDGHAKTRWHVARFGGGLPARSVTPEPPASPTPQEANYVRELLDAYGDHLRQTIRTVTDLATQPDLVEHFGDSRLEFYCAESLRAFSRDTLPPGEFEKLQDEVHAGIKDEVRSDHTDGYQRVIAVVKTARSLQLTGHALQSCMSVRDRGGICHQLANDQKVRWVK
jgi:hypothetical protein